VTALGRATRADSDDALVRSWLASLTSPHSWRNFEVTARRFLAEPPDGGLGAAAIEDVRDALGSASSLLAYGHRVGYLPFNAGAVPILFARYLTDSSERTPEMRAGNLTSASATNVSALS
jgi:hypothetical protein